MTERKDSEPDHTSRAQLLGASGKVIAAAGAAIAGTSLAAGASTSAALIAGGVAGVATGILEVVRRIGTWATTQREATWVSWWEHVSASYGATDIDDILRGRLDEPAVRATILQSLKSLENVVDPCVIPALGVLTAKYLPERKPDSFFRKLSRMLCEITTEEEFRGLQSLMRGVSASSVPDEVLHVVARSALEVVGRNYSNGPGMYIYVQQGDHRGMHFVGTAPDTSYLFHVVKSNGFGTEFSGGLGGGGATDSSIVISKTTASMICAIIEPGAA